jgi:hypothetical protein
MNGKVFDGDNVMKNKATGEFETLGSSLPAGRQGSRE